MLPKLGIIAGSGDLPGEIASIYVGKGGKCCIASIEGELNFPADCLSKAFALGAAGGIIKYFKENKVQNIIIIGGINRPHLKSLKVDLIGSMLIAKILKQKFLGDNNVLKIVANFLESKGFKVISPKEILASSDYTKQFSSKYFPSKQDKTDIELGIEVIKSLGNVDVGQSIIAYDGYVLGIEAAEGTDNLIRRCELLRKKPKGGVLVKMSKSSQDTRLDIPTIGPDTIFYLAKHGFNGVAIQKEGVIIVKPEEIRELLTKHGLFIHFI